MKISVVLFVAILLNAINPSLEGAIKWHTDYVKVRALSQQENKPLLLFFNGSDWSGEAMWMKREVLDTSAFGDKIGDRLLFMNVDFPQHSTLPEKTVSQNQELKRRFHIQETPTLLILDPLERVIAQIGYLPESSTQCADELLMILEQDFQLAQGLLNLDLNPIELKKLYHISQELGRPEAQEQIMEAGLKTSDPFFYLEKYRLLVGRGEHEQASTLELRAKLASLDPENTLGVHFTLALIDFQELSQKEGATDAAVQPLVSYLEQFGQKDPHNVWRIEMMIAQHYMDAEANEKALVHAERALQTAPTAVQGEIAHSLDYIRQTSAPK